MPPQRLEKIESAPGIGMVSEASNPQDLVHGRAADRARLGLTSRQNEKVAKLRNFLKSIGYANKRTTNHDFSFLPTGLKGPCPLDQVLGPEQPTKNLA
jgi:hypothetical protein